MNRHLRLKAVCLFLVSAGYVLVWNRRRTLPLLMLLVPGLGLGFAGVAMIRRRTGLG